MENHYDVLNIDQTASKGDIKKAFKKMVLRYHPDKNKGREEEATVRFRVIREAYNVLSDDLSRLAYDTKLNNAAFKGFDNTLMQKDDKKPDVRKAARQRYHPGTSIYTPNGIPTRGYPEDFAAEKRETLIAEWKDRFFS